MKKNHELSEEEQAEVSFKLADKKRRVEAITAAILIGMMANTYTNAHQTILDRMAYDAILLAEKAVKLIDDRYEE